MKKILLTLFGLMLMFSGNVSAQEVTIDFSGSTDNWEIGTTKLIDAKEFTYGGYTIILIITKTFMIFFCCARTQK